MLKKLVFFAALAASVVLASAGKAADALDLGSPAPTLKVGEWIQGDSVAKFEKGKVYVVEFWATWCGPCITAIPHINELSKKHKDVTFIGVSVLENDEFKGVPAFVKKMGEKMTYRVAVDLVEKDQEVSDGHMAKNWLQAAGQNGIPASFVVNGDGVVAWIGHPMELEKPLEQIIEGKYDIKTAQAEARKAKELEKAMMAAQRKIGAAMQQKDVEGIVEALEEIGKAQPQAKAMIGRQIVMVLGRQLKDGKTALELAETLAKKNDKDELGNAQMLFQAHIGLRDGKAAGEQAKKIVELAKGKPSEAQMLNEVAWSFVDPSAPKIKNPNLDVALSAAERAAEVSGDDPAVLDTLGLVYFEKGMLDKAVDTQKKAVEKSKGTPFEEDGELKDRLKKYEDAQKKGQDKN